MVEIVALEGVAIELLTIIVGVEFPKGTLVGEVLAMLDCVGRMDEKLLMSFVESGSLYMIDISQELVNPERQDIRINLLL